MNADLIAAGLSPFQPDKVAFTAGRLMLARIDELVAADTSFALETTLSSRLYLRLIPKWQEAGYRVKLYFLRLPDPDFAINRVEQRVRLGGHDIPQETIRRRFSRGCDNFCKHYQGLVDEWSIYDGAENPPQLLDSGDNHSPDKLMEESTEYRASGQTAHPVKPLNDPDFIGAEAALKRGSAKAVARALAAGLEPVVARPKDSPNKES